MGGEKKKIKPRVQERLLGILAITEVVDLFRQISSFKDQ